MFLKVKNSKHHNATIGINEDASASFGTFQIQAAISLREDSVQLHTKSQVTANTESIKIQ